MTGKEPDLRSRALKTWLGTPEGKLATHHTYPQLSNRPVQDGFRAGWDAAMNLINRIVTAETDEELAELRNKLQGNKS